MAAYIFLIISVIFLYVWAISRDALRQYWKSNDANGAWGIIHVLALFVATIFLIANANFVFKYETEILLKAQEVKNYKYHYDKLEQKLLKIEESQSIVQQENELMKQKLAKMKSLLNDGTK